MRELLNTISSLMKRDYLNIIIDKNICIKEKILF